MRVRRHAGYSHQYATISGPHRSRYKTSGGYRKDLHGPCPFSHLGVGEFGTHATDEVQVEIYEGLNVVILTYKSQERKRNR